MVRRPASSVRLSNANLAALGASRLSELLIDAAAGDGNLKRRLRLELAAASGPELLVLEIDKRLASLKSSRARVSWRKRPELIADLEAHHAMIVGPLAEAAPLAAFNSLAAWFGLFHGLKSRVKDPREELVALFERAAPDLWRLADEAAKLDPCVFEHLAEAVIAEPLAYARWMGAGESTLSPGLARRLLDTLQAKGEVPPLARSAVRRLADRAGDLDLWLSLATTEERRSPDLAAQFARRLLAAGRISDARAALEAAAPRASQGSERHGGSPSPSPAWETASIDVLDAEGFRTEAQALRWALFERDLSTTALRDYLSRLADFDDVEALDRAFAYAETYPDFELALDFLLSWPAHRQAARLVEIRRREAQRPSTHKAYWAAQLGQRFPQAAEILGG